MKSPNFNVLWAIEVYEAHRGYVLLSCGTENDPEDETPSCGESVRLNLITSQMNVPCYKMR